MDKFYCRSGGMRVVLSAEGPAEAAEAALKKMLATLHDDGPGLSVVMLVGRTGYGDKNPSVVATIPLARSIGFVVPDIKEAALLFGIDIESMPSEGREWLFGD